MSDVKYFHDAFFKHKEKSKQDAFILKYCKPKNIKRRRGTKNQQKLLQTKYKMYSSSQRSTIPICQQAFLKILHITKHRVQTIMKHFFKTGTLLPENRGGNHKQHKFAEKLNAVKNFINSFSCDEAHYCRGKTKRYYLPAELSINQMYKMYNAQADANLTVKRGYFRSIFNNCYNLGFGSPRTDVCSNCLQYDELIKTYEKSGDDQKKSDALIQKRVHKLRAKAFFQLVKEEEDGMITLCFDCQKNCPIPKLPDQSTYYSRQLYLYNFTIVQGSSKAKLSPENTFAYCWTEDTFAKSSNEIASAVYHRLCSTDWTGISKVRLIADGCGGQNKNTTMVGMLAKWLTNNAPSNIKNIQLIFPVVGHSFIPPDRVFGIIEKDVRKREIIKNAEGYMDIIKNYSTIINLGKGDCKVYNWKDSLKTILKDVGSWHFPFQKSKRFYIRRTKSKVDVVVKGNLFYRVDDGIFRGITRKDKNINMLNPPEIHSSGKVNNNKLKDVKNLLQTHYGDNWIQDEELVYFKNLILPESNVDEEAILPLDDNENDTLCECQDDSTDLKI